MNISKGGVRAPNGKVYPNQAQRHLLRKFIAEKQEQCIEAGIKPIRFKLVDFRKWAPELNKLGPPLRSAPKWKNCWFYHKKKRNFYDFFYEKLRQDSHAEKEVCGEKLSKKRNVSGKVQQRKFIELLKQKRQESIAKGDEVTILTTQDFENWTEILNKLGQEYPVEKWKMCWFIHKKKKNGFFEFINRRRRKSEIGIELKRISNSPNARGKMNKKQLEILEKFIQERKTNSTGDKVQIYTKDFIDLRKTLNKLGPPYRTVNEWKYTWRHTKKNAKKNPKNNFAIDVQELGCESSDAYYFTNESSDFSSDSELQTTSSITGTNENFGENKDSSDSCTD
ncbi:uncharacterized protein LOC129789330 isoform X4 [Lutzomyia longipalpis]|uniref:uncharacterized protein LOC129789330 isoform X4 n=1 Tax=Lutzomyia longipalpis TaxID=7200 RepID=UPI0024833527|nr:uncharacterized protein LOC129789330 isoform X4 [Lutzomyia longipalpis]